MVNTNRNTQKKDHHINTYSCVFNIVTHFLLAFSMNALNCWPLLLNIWLKAQGFHSICVVTTVADLMVLWKHDNETIETVETIAMTYVQYKSNVLSFSWQQLVASQSLHTPLLGCACTCCGAGSYTWPIEVFEPSRTKEWCTPVEYNNIECNNTVCDTFIWKLFSIISMQAYVVICNLVIFDTAVKSLLDENSIFFKPIFMLHPIPGCQRIF